MKAQVDTIKIKMTLEEAEDFKQEIDKLTGLIPSADLESILPEFPMINTFLKTLRIEPGIPF